MRCRNDEEVAMLVAVEVKTSVDESAAISGLPGGLLIDKNQGHLALQKQLSRLVRLLFLSACHDNRLERIVRRQRRVYANTKTLWRHP